MNLKKIPQRTCIGCNVQKNKKDLIRIVINKQGQINIDKTGKANGRGAYICDSIDCLEKMIKSKRLEKSFETKINDDIYNVLRDEIINKI
ncbi:MAG: YlxR family protein [Clostridia bacterium]|nr:YlxR family protein [Clostridia bacterium]